MTRRGLLLTMTEPPPAMEEEFNAWYDSEHLAERLAIIGFRSARRWVANCAPGEGRYLATRFEAATPWTRRCLSKAVIFRRWACEQRERSADPHPLAKAVLLLAQDTPFETPRIPGALVRLYRAYGA